MVIILKNIILAEVPLEAGSMGIETSGEEVIFRCNLITEKNGKIDDFNAGHITSKEAAILIDDLNKEFLKSSVIDKFGNGKFYSGISYRHLFVKNGSKLSDLKTTLLMILLVKILMILQIGILMNF